MDRCPLKGLPNPVGKNFWQVESTVLGSGIDFFNIGEVPCTVVLTVPCDASIIKLFDPLDGDIQSFSKGNAECGEPVIRYIPFRGFNKGLLVIEETGLGILKVFFELVDLCFVFLILGLDLVLILLMTAVRSFDEGIDNGMECGWIQVGGGDSIADQLG